MQAANFKHSVVPPLIIADCLVIYLLKLEYAEYLCCELLLFLFSTLYFIEKSTILFYIKIMF
jgi:hypothetical protein